MQHVQFYVITFPASGVSTVMRSKLTSGGKPEVSLMNADGQFRTVTEIPELFTAQLIRNLPSHYATFTD